MNSHLQKLQLRFLGSYASEFSLYIRNKAGTYLGYREHGENRIPIPYFETQAFLAHKTHQPSGLIGPSTRWQVLVAELKFMQLPHFCAPFG
jgi:hypothetical protein